MLAGEAYDAMDPELVAARAHARALCTQLNASPETLEPGNPAQEARRTLAGALFGPQKSPTEIDMRYEGAIYRPPSEADAYILQATIGCSWNHCTYCDMYRADTYRVRPREEILEDLRAARAAYGEEVRKVFVADGDALGMETETWLEILAACAAAFPRLKRVSAYATAMNLLRKPDKELLRLREAGLVQLYIGPESGDDVTMKRIAKGAGFAEHAEAAAKAHRAGIKLSTIFLLGVGGVERDHASNYLPLGGRLPRDRERILAGVDGALRGELLLRPEWARGL